MTHICVMSSHKPIRIYMGGLILGVNTLYRLCCFFKLFPMVGKGLSSANLTIVSLILCVCRGTTSLQGLADQLLGAELNKSPRLRCSNWEAETLSQDQVSELMTDSIIKLIKTLF